MQHVNTTKHETLDNAKKDVSESRLVNNFGNNLHLNVTKSDKINQRWVLTEY